MGRLVTFLARIINDNRWTGRPPAHAIGVDQQTAFLMQHANDGKSPYGTLTYSAISAPGVFGAVYVLSPVSAPIIDAGCCGLNFSVNVQKIPAGFPPSPVDYQIHVIDGEHLCSAWTVALHYQMLITLAP